MFFIRPNSCLQFDSKLNRLKKFMVLFVWVYCYCFFLFVHVVPLLLHFSTPHFYLLRLSVHSALKYAWERDDI